MKLPKQVIFRTIENSQRLFARHPRKIIEKRIDRIARADMIEKTAHRHARPGKDGFSAQSLGINRYETF